MLQEPFPLFMSSIFKHSSFSRASVAAEAGGGPVLSCCGGVILFTNWVKRLLTLFCRGGLPAPPPNKFWKKAMAGCLIQHVLALKTGKNKKKYRTLQKNKSSKLNQILFP
jgi:hypothetical protein